MEKKLHEIPLNEEVLVKRLDDSGRNIALRLMDIGMVPGAKIKCTMRSPLGDPSAYLIKGSIIALRKCDADIVTVETSPENSLQHE